MQLFPAFYTFKIIQMFLNTDSKKKNNKSMKREKHGG